MIKINGLEKSFARQKVLNDINLEINPGKIYAVLGHNGSGKTTLIKALLGLVIPDKGEMTVNGESVKGKHDYRKDFGYISQIARFPQNLTVKELFAMISDLRHESLEFKILIDHFGIKKEMDKKLGHLSGGTRQKVNVVNALMLDPPVLVCDEPTVGLDPASVIKLKEILKKKRSDGKTIILITHIIGLVEELADHVFLLQDGNMNFSGTVDELKKKENQDNLEGALANLMQKIESE